MGLGSSRKITTQHAAPASSGTQTTSAPPLARSTSHNARAAPPQTGSSRMAMMNLIHFGTRQNSEFGIRKPAESACRVEPWLERNRRTARRYSNPA
jgi:hypothetical protein